MVVPYDVAWGLLQFVSADSEVTSSGEHESTVLHTARPPQYPIEYTSQVLLVPKADTTKMWLCVAYTELNKIREGCLSELDGKQCNDGAVHGTICECFHCIRTLGLIHYSRH